jgi:hypothetical protein
MRIALKKISQNSSWNSHVSLITFLFYSSTQSPVALIIHHLHSLHTCILCTERDREIIIIASISKNQNYRRIHIFPLNQTLKDEVSSFSSISSSHSNNEDKQRGSPSSSSSIKDMQGVEEENEEVVYKDNGEE